MNNNQALLIRIKNGDKSALDTLVKENTGLVVSIAKRFMGRGTDFEDLTQIGVIGLIKAAKKFDSSFGVVFSTYAVPLITGEIRRFLRDDGMVKVSRSLKETAVKGKNAAEMLRRKNGCDPTLSEISEYCKISVEELSSAFDASNSYTSLNSLIGNDSETEMIDCLSDSSSEEKIIDNLFIKQSLEGLEPRQRQIIVFRYLNGKTQTEIAKILGISQVQVSRIEKKALENIRLSYYV